ncbi:MAG: alpha/beta fold hydrolase [Myxococcales bacterium]|nr:alpha/beta fold hydrolase [Myxococcales bacterium]
MADGSTLPDLRRSGPRFDRADLLRTVGDGMLALTWRLCSPGDRAPFLRAGQQPLTRLRYRADDGWGADLFHLAPLPGASAEPVVLAHGLGGSHRDFALEAGRGLAAALRAAGFSVYLLEHRGDPCAVAPPGAAPFNVDDIATRDVPAALDRVVEHSGFPRVLWVGHGLGAQLWCLSRALGGEDRFAASSLIAPAVRFRPGASALRAAGLVAALLPRGWVLPTRRAQALLTPFVAGGADVASPDTDGARARGRLRYGAGDLHGGVVRQVARWVAEGSLTDATGRLDIVSALSPAVVQVVLPTEDPACPPGAVEPLIVRLGADVVDLPAGFGHLDPLLGEHAAAQAHAPIVAFLSSHRRLVNNLDSNAYR